MPMVGQADGTDRSEITGKSKIFTWPSLPTFTHSLIFFTACSEDKIHQRDEIDDMTPNRPLSTAALSAHVSLE